MRTPVRVVTSQESAARDASAIAAGIPARALMQRAGAAVASEIALRFRERLSEGVALFAGPGNNGGDAWVAARALGAAGARVRVVEPVPAATDNARAERALTLDALGGDCVTQAADGDRGEGIVVDGLLGTGARTRGGGQANPLAGAMRLARQMQARGAAVVAIDIVSGIDATTGEFHADASAPVADLTVTFGTVKRAHLVRREMAGTVVVVDIGLGRHAALDDGAPILVDEFFVDEHLPMIHADAHKGDRKKLAIIGGAEGMAGAAILAARAALRSGVGMVKLVVDKPTLPVIQEAEPHALAAVWPEDDASVERDIAKWADVVVIGPGLGRDDKSRALLERVLRAWRGPTLLDADALTLFEGNAAGFAAALGNRVALITPHPAEFSRVSGVSVDAVLAQRFEIGRALAAQLGATVLLKGVPTVITSPTGECLVSATGTPALATGGSGDVLSGIAGTLLGQTGDPLVAAAMAAFVHGRAAERVPQSSGVRGISLEDIVAELREAWSVDARPLRYPVLAELPAIGDAS